MSKNKCCDEKKSETALVLGPADGKGQKKTNQSSFEDLLTAKEKTTSTVLVRDT